jgi:hypothetical protein
MIFFSVNVACDNELRQKCLAIFSPLNFLVTTLPNVKQKGVERPGFQM